MDSVVKRSLLAAVITMNILLGSDESEGDRGRGAMYTF